MVEKLVGLPVASGDALLEALRELERRFSQNAAVLPQSEEPRDLWAGVFFRIGDIELLAPLEEIGEVLELPRDITPIPSTKTWVCGIANNRGSLLPIFDLQAFLLGTSTVRNVKARVLVVRQETFPFGLLVGEVVGIRHFDVSARAQEAPDLDDLLMPWVVGSFAWDEQHYPVFNLHRLSSDETFNLVAA
ncbi:MAG: chemotaxis protein CheW [Pseudomonadota bacterium]|nr:chemotaxis protein CheW [Pseudomonadota bacterium]